MNSIDVNSAVAVRKALKQRGCSTTTPGLKGDARHNELRKRLQAEMGPSSLDTARSTTSVSSVSSTYSSVSTLKSALESRQLDTRTPGLKGGARKELLEQRLAEAMYSNVDEESSDVQEVTATAATAATASNPGNRSSRSNTATHTNTPPPYSQVGRRKPSHEQRPLDRSGSYTSRAAVVNPDCSATSTATPTESATPSSPSTRPSSSPGLRKITSNTARVPPWAVRTTRVGRGRGRSRGACRGVSSSLSRRAGSSSRNKHKNSSNNKGNSNNSNNSNNRNNRNNRNNQQRRPLTEVGNEGSATARQHETTPRGTRGQPPVSARITARLTAVESLHTEAVEELEDAK